MLVGSRQQQMTIANVVEAFSLICNDADLYCTSNAYLVSGSECEATA